MKMYERVADRYLKEGASQIIYRREEDNDHFFIVVYKDQGYPSIEYEELGFANASLRSFDLSKSNDLTNAECIQDVLNLIKTYPSLKKGKTLPVLVLYESDLDPDYHSRGIGKQLYLECMKEGWKDNGKKPFIFIPHYCISGKTSNEAKRVWSSLARRYPSSGDCIAVIESP